MKRHTLCKPVSKLANRCVVSASNFLAAASISFMDERLEKSLSEIVHYALLLAAPSDSNDFSIPEKDHVHL